MNSFDAIMDMAAGHKGSIDAVEALLPVPKLAKQLARISDDRWLSGMAITIFRSGFSWKVVENKWPGFEDAFHGFDPHRVAMFSDEEFDALVSNRAVIRNGQKLRAVLDNAVFVTDLAREHGTAARFFADWPATDFTGLWALLSKRGSRLGGNSGSYFLRQMGWDSPIMSRDVVTALVREGVIDKAPTSKKALAAVQEAFVIWHEESGRPLSAISRTLAASVS